MQLSPRDDIIDRVERGEITLEEAALEAFGLGLPPFEREPSWDAFDPMAEASWSLPMAVAWISRRTPHAVREAWDAYRQECWHWVFRRSRLGFDGPVREGYRLEQRSPASLDDLALEDTLARYDGAKAPLLSAGEARNALWMALEQELVVASGLEGTTDRREPIPAMQWRDLKPGKWGARETVSAGSLFYRDVVVPAKAVEMLWAAIPEPSPIRQMVRTIDPLGPGYMPLFCAAQWIATKGWTQSVDPTDVAVWQSVYRTLLDSVASEQVKVIGLKDGRREPVAGFHFAGCRIAYPYAEASLELIMSEVMYLQSYSYD